MPDVCIGLDTAARHRYWRWSAFRHAVIAAGLAWGLWAEPDLWWWVGPIGAVFLISILYRINRGYSRTLLKPDGMVFRTFLGSKSIPWAEVTRIEMRSYHARLGDWWELRVFRVHGRSLRVPGAFSSSRKDVEDLKTKLSVIRAYWSHESVH
ncbi:hypothetical protein [Streptomyces sp. NPDC101165]|uniref:hypothetical protein n=1 Tax=Streptomyces sp. NPDC101165 TaxID=3366119 RepID=UPI0037F5B928